MKPKDIFIFLMGILCLIIFLQNTQVVNIQILFWKISMSRIILLPLILFVGFGIGFFVGKNFQNRQ